MRAAICRYSAGGVTMPPSPSTGSTTNAATSPDGLLPDDVREGVGAGDVARRIGQPERAAVAVRGRAERDAGEVRAVVLLAGACCR